MSRVRKAANGMEKPPTMLGEPSRPGQVEGGNTDPVVVTGETEIKKLPILRPGERVRSVAYRYETNEALFIIDEASAYNVVEPYFSPPQPLVDMGFVTPQTRVLYFNGNSFIDIDDVFSQSRLREEIVGGRYKYYKFNASAWRPVSQPTPYLDRPGIEQLGKEGTLGDICILVGEDKSERGPGLPGFGNGYGAIIFVIPSLLGVTRDLGASPIYPTSPIFCPVMTDWPDLTNMEFFNVVWRDTSESGDGLDGFVLGEAYVVGTLREGTSHIPKAYRLYIQSDGRSVEDAHVVTINRPDLHVYIEDLHIDDMIPNGILFGCDFDDENLVLHVAGSSYSGDRQIFASWSRTDGWTNRSPDIDEEFNVIVDGTDGFLIQDANGIRIISNSSDFISSGVKRGQPIWVDITDFNDTADTIAGGVGDDNLRNFCINQGQSGLFFVQRVISKTTLMLDKRMPDTLVSHEYADTPGSPNCVLSSLFDWGFLREDITESDTTIDVDVNVDMVQTLVRHSTQFFTTPPQKGDILTQAVTGARMYVLAAGNAGPVSGYVQGIMLPDYVNPGVVMFNGVNNITSDNTHGAMNPANITVGLASYQNQFPAPGTIYINGEQINYTGSNSALVTYDGLPYRRWTLTGCQRGVNGTNAVPHVAQYAISGGSESPWVRTVCVRCVSRDFKSFTRLTDVNFSGDGTNLFITGDNGFMVRYDPDIDGYVDYRGSMPIPETLDFGRMQWKPDGESGLVVANTVNGSYVYLLRADYLRRITVPTSGIINDIAWTPDGMSALICGKYVHKYAKKVNVDVAEKEPKVSPIRYMWHKRYLGAFAGEYDRLPLILRGQSDVLPLDDLNSDTLTLVAEFGIPMYQTAFPFFPYVDIELRVFLASRGDDTEYIRRNFWRSVNMSDTMYWMNPNNFEGPPKNGLPSNEASWHSGVTPPYDLNPFYSFKKIWNLPVWARYIAVDFVMRGTRAMGPIILGPFWETSYITVGVQGGIK